MPVYTLNTALGSCSATMTKTYIDSTGNDMTDELNRGDYIRVGDPTNGEVFRVSTDMKRSFNKTYIPLGTVEDPNVVASFVVHHFKNDLLTRYIFWRIFNDILTNLARTVTNFDER